MTEKDYVQATLFEHRFWLQILGDHARFIQGSLGPSEAAEAEKAKRFKELFDSLLERARRNLSRPDLEALNVDAEKAAKDLREFKLHLQARQLEGHIAFALPPDFVNHMVNELEEYLNVLENLLAGEPPTPMHPVHYHLIWLSDASGHAAFISGHLDEVEAELRQRSQQYEEHFDKYYLKSVAMASFLRTGLTDFPSLDRFNLQAGSETDFFRHFLLQLLEATEANQVLTSFVPLVPDHMSREECYYLIKLSEVSGLKAPDCDPTRPRVQE